VADGIVSDLFVFVPTMDWFGLSNLSLRSIQSLSCLSRPDDERGCLGSLISPDTRSGRRTARSKFW